MSLESTFLETVRREPHVATHRMIFADWLQEQGDARGELLNIQEQLRQINVDNREYLEHRMHELLAEDVSPLTFRETNFLGLEFTLIFPGTYLMGSPQSEKGHSRNETQVEVTISQPFWMGTTLVTVEQWLKLMDVNPWGNRVQEQRSVQWPAVGMDWWQAATFCHRMNLDPRHGEDVLGDFHLPSEAQWEYACRSGTTTRFHFGEDTERMSDFVSRYVDGSVRSSQPVASLKPNPWGLFDMHGLVDEWCRDTWESRLSGGTDPLIDDKSKTGGRVVRGGNRISPVHLLRSAFRTGFGSRDRYSDLGFRCVAAWKE